MTPPASEAEQEFLDLAYDKVRSMVNRLFIALFVALIIVVAAILVLRFIELDREGRRSAENLADVLSESVAIRLGAVDGALAEIAIGNHIIGGPEGSAREWGELLRTAQLGLSGLSALFVLDGDGTILHSTLGLIKGITWADREIFQELAKGRPNQLVVDLPISMVAGNSVLIPFGRSLTDPRGNFIGAAIATLLPNQLQEFLATFDLGDTGVAWILLSSGEVLFREDAASESGEANDTTDPPIFAQDRAIEQNGFAKGAISEGGPGYLTAYRQSRIGDLVVAVSLAENEFVGRWRFEAIAGLILVVISGVVLFLAARRIKSAVLDALATAPDDEADDEILSSPDLSEAR